MNQNIAHNNNIYPDNRSNEDIFFIQNISHSPKRHGYPIPPIHRHPYYEIIFVTSGTSILTIDFKEYPLKKGDVCFLSPSQVHQPLQSSEDYTAFLLRFYPAIFDNSDFFNHITIFDHNFLSLNEEEYPRRFRLLSDLQNEFGQEAILKNFALGNLLKCFLISIQRIIPEHFVVKPNQNLFSRLNCLIVDNEFQIKIPSYYAKELKISTRTLNAISKEFTGLSSREYIASKTLLEAKRLLSYTNLSIKEIAYNLGFEDSAYFSRFFKQGTDQSPLLFRDTILAS